MTTRLLFVHALSPLHPGTGQGVGVIDLPIAREKATGLPYLPGSSVKGTLRDSGSLDNDTKAAIFGPDTINAAHFAGAAQFADQRLLLLPVRSLAGVFAWVTSPYVLRRFARDASDAGVNTPPRWSAADLPDVTGVCTVATDTRLAVTTAGKVVLEDLDLTPHPTHVADEWAAWLGAQLYPDGEADATVWRDMLRQRLCVVHDDLLGFLLTTATEVTARVRLEDDVKTVARGALWYEEALPAETVLAGLVSVSEIKDKRRKDLDGAAVLMEIRRLTGGALQFGGKATVGRGLCRVRVGGA
jgi:CRISPR-associated protein Cmr4